MDSTRVRRWVAVAVAMGGLCSTAVAQVGRIAGTVTDTLNRRRLAGATVVIDGLKRVFVTDSSGRFVADSVPPGTYQVDVTLAGFQNYKARDIVVRQNTAVRVDAKLSVGTLQESILVSANAAILQTETAAVQTQTTSKQIETLPTSGRSFQSLLVITPGVGQPDYFQQGGTNNPSRSITGTKIDGGTAPWPGRSQRISASNPRSSPAAQDTIGCQ